MKPDILRFEVPGVPKAKGRPRFRPIKTKAGKSFVHTYTPSDTANYENLVKLSAATAAKEIGWEIPAAPAAYAVKLAIMLPIPQSWPNWRQMAALSGRVRPAGTDIDNFIKSLLDGCNGVLWADDSEVWSVDATKLYSRTPGMAATVTRRDVPTRAGE